MCGTCWNADMFDEKVKKYGKEVCDGSDMLLMTLDELKARLERTSSDAQHTFRIFNKAIIDLPKGQKHLNFTPKNRTNSIHVKFV
tara:strand:- start:1065 stop:1319 length:255 start_codon:yes stop_codon:yes gene_type:complete